jgi:glycosyltransferase involved in cell wall biosynthesis
MKYEEIQLERSALNPPDEWASLRMPSAFVPALASVIVPTFNRAMFIAEAIDSVLNQTYRPIELLIVDDGSSDATGEVVRAKLSAAPDDPAFSAIYIRQPNRGASAARNQGLLHSRGEFIQYLDSDDVLVRHKLALHVRALQSDEGLDIVWSGWRVLPTDPLPAALNEANQVDPPSVPNSLRPTQQIIPWEPWPTLTRRRFLAPHPLWNEHVSRWDDWEYALRQMTAQPKRACSPEIGYIQREHEHGRRFDFDFNPAGVEVGLIACRKAARASAPESEESSTLAQLVADRYWEVGLEAVRRGTAGQACEAFAGACRFGSRLPFRLKTSGYWFLTRFAGLTLTSKCLPPAHSTCVRNSG